MTRLECQSFDSEHGTAILCTFGGDAEYIGGPAFDDAQDSSYCENVSHVVDWNEVL